MFGIDVSSAPIRDGVLTGPLHFSTEKAAGTYPWSKRVDFIANGIVTLRRLSASTCKQQHRDVPHYSVKVAGKPVAHVAATAPVVVNGKATTMAEFYNSLTVVVFI